MRIEETTESKPRLRYRARAASDVRADYERLQTFKIEDVGSPAWRSQREDVVRLRAEAYKDAVARDSSAERIETIVAGTRAMDTLVRELLCAETWRVSALPRMLALDPRLREDAVMKYAVYLVLYHESVLANLCELVAFDTDAYAKVDDDVVVELADYCHRALARLNDVAKKSESESHEEREASTIEDQLESIEFVLSISALGILRSIAEKLEKLALGVQTRLLDVHDIAAALVPLLDSKPWLRRRNGKLQTFTDGVWVEASADEAWNANIRVGRCEAQVWLTLHAVLCEPCCRRTYRWDESRKDNILRLQKHLHESKIDQIPVLRDIAALMDQLSVQGSGSMSTSRDAGLIIEVIPTLRVGLTQGVDFDALSASIVKHHFNLDDHALKASLARDMATLCDGLSLGEERAANIPNASVAASNTIQIDILRERRSLSSSEVSYDNVFSAEYDAVGEPVEVKTQKSKIRGLRRQLKERSVKVSLSTFHHFDGKIRVTFDSRTITSLFNLRKSPINSESHAVWISVGTLSSDGFAAQLRLDPSSASDTASYYSLSDAYLTIRAP